jgi:CRP-like cAMP-binding protein
MHENILANFALHIQLDPVETEKVKAALQYRTVKKNEVLLNEGAICRNLYFVEQGCLRVFNTDANGDEHNILFCPENWWSADIASFSLQSPAFYSIAALEQTVVLFFSYADLEDLYETVPKMERFFRILVQNGFSLYQRRMTSSLSKTAEERYALFDSQYPGLEQRIAQKQIASYLGITPVFLSMIRGRKS